MRRPLCTRHAIVLVSFFVLACEEPQHQDPAPRTCLDPDVTPTDTPDVPVTYTTDKLEIHVEEGRFMCAGTAQDLDLFAKYVGEQVGIQSERRVPLFLLDSVEGLCSAKASGCVRRDGTAVVSTLSGLQHEITHSVVCETRFGAPAILAEGLAVSFEPFPNSSQGIPSEFADLPGDPPDFSYSEAGHFVRWLFEALGPEAFMDLYATANYSSGVWTAIEDAYGLTVEDDYLATAPSTWVPHRQCDDVPLLEPDPDGVWTFDLHFDCADPNTRGPYLGASFSFWSDMYQSYLIDIPAPGMYRLEHPDYLDDAAGDIGVFVEHCRFDDHPSEPDKYANGPRVVFFTLVDHDAVYEFPLAGLWRVDVLRKHGPPSDAWLTIQPEPPP